MLGTIGVGAVGALAGCLRGDGQTQSGNDEIQSTAQNPHLEPSSGGETRSVEAAISKLERNYRQLGRVPIVEDGVFVFETTRFIDVFEDDSGLSIAETPSEIFRDDSKPDRLDSTAKGFAAAADLSVWLFNQRLLLFDTIRSSRRFVQSYDEGYERPIEHLQNGLQALRTVPENGERIDVSLSHVREEQFSIEGYDLDTVSPANEMVQKIAMWARPAYEGLSHTLRGFQLLEAAERIGDPHAPFPYTEREYERVAAEFRTAEASFTHAHGRGRRLAHLSETVESHRCAASTLREGFEMAVVGTQKLNAGQLTEAERIATEVEERFVRATLRCS